MRAVESFAVVASVLVDIERQSDAASCATVIYMRLLDYEKTIVLHEGHVRGTAC